MPSVKISENSTNTEYKYDSSCIHKKNVVLDLDETLISGKACDDEIDFDKDKEQLMKFKFHNMDDLYLISERPNVQDFLTELFENYTVSVWTAASKDYALFIIENVLLKNPQNTPPRHLKYIFWSDHGSLSKKLYDKKPKKLSLLWDIFRLPGFDPYNTIIVDDYDKVTVCQPDNAIKIAEFDCTRDGHENDTELTSMCATLEDKFQILKAKRPEIVLENTELDEIHKRNMVNKIESDDVTDSSDDGGSDSSDDDSGSNSSDDDGSDDDDASNDLIEEMSDSDKNQPISKEEDNAKVSENISIKKPSQEQDSLENKSNDLLVNTQNKDDTDVSDNKDDTDVSNNKDDTDASNNKDDTDASDNSVPATPIDLSGINVNPDLQKATEQNSSEYEQQNVLSVDSNKENAQYENIKKITEKTGDSGDSDDSDSDDSDDSENKIVRTIDAPSIQKSYPPEEHTTVKSVEDPEKMFEKLKEVAKHNFDKGSSHDDDDDDDDGESKVCKKCSEDFITYSGKDLCPGCR